MAAKSRKRATLDAYFETRVAKSLSVWQTFHSAFGNCAPMNSGESGITRKFHYSRTYLENTWRTVLSMANYKILCFKLVRD